MANKAYGALTITDVTDGKSLLTLITNYSYNQTNINTYSASGYSGTWTVEDVKGAKVDDTVFLRVTNTAKSGYCYIIALVTKVNSSTSITCSSIGLLDKGETGQPGAPGSPGAPGTSPTAYNMIVSTVAIVDNNGTWSPSTIKLDGKSQTGSSAIANYACRWKVEISADGVNWTQNYLSSANEASKTWTITKGSLTSALTHVRVSMYAAGGTTTLLDQQIIPVVKDGRTPYIHIKYSEDGTTFTGNNGDDPGAFMGTLTDYNPTASTKFSDYTWQRVTQDLEDNLNGIQEGLNSLQALVSSNTNLIQEKDKIIMELQQSFSSVNSQLSSLQRDYNAQFGVTSQGIVGQVTESINQLQAAMNQAQQQLSSITKQMQFDTDGLTISQPDAPYRVNIDNDEIAMYFDSNKMLDINATTETVHAPKMKVDRSMNLFGFVGSIDANGVVTWDYVGL